MRGSMREESESVAAFDYLNAVHADYRESLGRLHEAAEALQNDFKMFAVTLPLLSAAVAALSAHKVMLGDVELVPLEGPSGSYSLTFWAFAACVTLVAILSFRDYTRAVGFEHLLYTVLRHERHYVALVRALLPADAGRPVTGAEYFRTKSWASCGKS